MNNFKEKETIKKLEELGYVIITKKKYEKMLNKVNFLEALEMAGVDNWSGISVAHDIMDEEF